jgi:hypothetical protein
MVVSIKPSCPPKYTLRNAYHTKSGKLVHARCVKKTGIVSSGTSKAYTLKEIRKSRKNALNALSFSKKHNIPYRERCKEGETLRSGYRRTSYNRKTGKYTGKHYKHAIVAPGCIKKRGSTKIPTRTEKQKSKRSTIIILNNDDHFLSEYGYFEVETKTKEERLDSLTKLINHFKPIKGEAATYNYIIKALNARYILNRNSNPKVAKIFKSDQKTISKVYKDLKNNYNEIIV